MGKPAKLLCLATFISNMHTCISSKLAIVILCLTVSFKHSLDATNRVMVLKNNLQKLSNSDTFNSDKESFYDTLSQEQEPSKRHTGGKLMKDEDVYYNYYENLM